MHQTHDILQPTLIEGAQFIDDRGSISFVNDFSFAERGIQRFYQVENNALKTIRAFHGHRNEDKYVYVTKGTVLVCAVWLDDYVKPSKKNQVHRFVLSSTQPKILHIPAGYANGFSSLSTRANIQFFSTSTLEESHEDDYRFPYDYWGKNIWKVENR